MLLINFSASAREASTIVAALNHFRSTVLYPDNIVLEFNDVTEPGSAVESLSMDELDYLVRRISGLTDD